MDYKFFSFFIKICSDLQVICKDTSISPTVYDFGVIYWLGYLWIQFLHNQLSYFNTNVISSPEVQIMKTLPSCCNSAVKD